MSTRIKTIEQLEEYVGAGKGLWFLSIVESHTFGDMSKRECAEMIMGGLKPMSERWPDILAELGESDDGRLDFPTESQLADQLVQFGWWDK